MPRGPESLGEWELPKLRAAFSWEVGRRSHWSHCCRLTSKMVPMLTYALNFRSHKRVSCTLATEHIAPRTTRMLTMESWSGILRREVLSVQPSWIRAHFRGDLEEPCQFVKT